MADFSQEYVLQQDRQNYRDYDGNGFNASTQRPETLRTLKKIASDYWEMGKHGAAIGAAAGSFFPGVGTVSGALLGFAAGIGVRSYGTGFDILDSALAFTRDSDSDDFN